MRRRRRRPGRAARSQRLLHLSVERAEASISSSGSIVSCMTPIRNGMLTQDLLFFVNAASQRRQI
ncbi:MAG TPA: hypothetical protein VKC62_00645 [Gaiellaceae bacterium]|nr:hypothetical protein [Gaiellaceae bacterium]